MQRTTSLRTTAAIFTTAALSISACSSDGDDSASTSASETTAAATETNASTSAATTGTPDTTAMSDTTSGETDTTEAGAETTGAGSAPDAVSPVAVDPERCEQNKAAGKITFLTGFDFAAASSIVEVIYAEDQGLYEDLCLDVEINKSSSVDNYALVSTGTGTFASGGSFAEAAAFAGGGDANYQVVQVDGREAIDALLLKPGYDTLESVKGQTIGVKFKLPPSIEVMLSNAGLKIGEDYQTVLLDGFVPTVHYAIDEIVGFPGWRSNEPKTLEREGLEFTEFDAAKEGVPGSFGVIIANNDFVSEHPTAAEDFVRATLKGLEMAIDQPDAAAAASVAMIEGAGNPAFLSAEGETARWKTEADILTATKPADAPIGTPNPELLQAEIDAYEPTGLFEGLTLPDMATFVNTDLIDAISDGASINWPS